MRFDFLTPEIFDFLVMANLGVAVLLIAFRFYQDMTHVDKQPAQLRQQAHDESSHDNLTVEEIETNRQQLDETQKHSHKLGEK
ncbi:MAG: hypothetical protein WBC91_02700 [Phototrophicaceae bacterium]